MHHETRDESALFDSSTNPSLAAGETGGRSKTKREYNSDDQRRQRGEAMPEEDPDIQMG